MSSQAVEKSALILMKSDEADATIDVLERDLPGVEVTDTERTAISRRREIVVSMDKVGQELGRPIELSQWLVIMSSFRRRAAPDLISPVTSRWSTRGGA